MSGTTDIGYARNKQYASGVSNKQPRKHAVLRNENHVWVKLCDGRPATREYKGWHSTVECMKCLEKLEEVFKK